MSSRRRSICRRCRRCWSIRACAWRRATCSPGLPAARRQDISGRRAARARRFDRVARRARQRSHASRDRLRAGDRRRAEPRCAPCRAPGSRACRARGRPALRCSLLPARPPRRRNGSRPRHQDWWVYPAHYGRHSALENARFAGNRCQPGDLPVGSVAPQEMEMKFRRIVVAVAALIAAIAVTAADPALARAKHKAAPPLRRPAVSILLELSAARLADAAAERLRAAGLSIRPVYRPGPRSQYPSSAAARSGDAVTRPL